MEIQAVVDLLASETEGQFGQRCALALGAMERREIGAEDLRNKMEAWWRKRLCRVIAEYQEWWVEGTLFKAQRQPFEEWVEAKFQKRRLDAEERLEEVAFDRLDDRERYERVEGQYVLCGSEVPSDIKYFWYRRIIAGRRRWKDDKAGLDFWTKENVKQNWNTWPIN